MAHSEIWDATYEAEPSNTDDASGGAGEFRDLKRNIRERAEVDHDWDDVNNAGKHNQVTLQRAAVKPTLSGTDGAVYAKDDGSGNTEAFFEDDSGNEVQLTEGGAAAPSAVQKTGDEMTGDLDMSGADLKLDNDQSLLGDVAATGSYENLIKRNASDQVEVGNTSGEVLIKGDDVNGLQFDEGAGPFEIFHRGNVEYFNSGELAIPNQYTRATTAHGLSGTPQIWTAQLVCKVVDGNFSIGDAIECPREFYGASPIELNGIQIDWDATNMGYVCGTDIVVFNEDTPFGNRDLNITKSSWRLVVTALYFNFA